MSVYNINREPLSWEPQSLTYARLGLCAQCIAQLEHDAFNCPDIKSETPNFVNTGINCIEILSGKIAPDKELHQGSKMLLAPLGYGTNQFMVQVYNGHNLFDFYNHELPQFRTAMYTFPLLNGSCVGVCTNDGLWEFEMDATGQVASYVPRSFGTYRKIFDPHPLSSLLHQAQGTA